MQDDIEVRAGRTGQGVYVRFARYDAAAIASFKSAFPARTWHAGKKVWGVPGTDAAKVAGWLADIRATRTEVVKDWCPSRRPGDVFRHEGGRMVAVVRLVEKGGRAVSGLRLDSAYQVRPATDEERARVEESEAAARAIVDARKAQEAAAALLVARVEEVRKEAVAHGELVDESHPQGVPVAAHEALKRFKTAPDGSLLAVAGSRHAHGCDYLEPFYRRVRGALAVELADKLRTLIA